MRVIKSNCCLWYDFRYDSVSHSRVVNNLRSRTVDACLHIVDRLMWHLFRSPSKVYPVFLSLKNNDSFQVLSKSDLSKFWRESGVRCFILTSNFDHIYNATDWHVKELSLLGQP